MENVIGRSWESCGKTVGTSWEILWEYYGVVEECCGNILGILWVCYVNAMATAWEYNGKYYSYGNTMEGHRGTKLGNAWNYYGNALGTM